MRTATGLAAALKEMKLSRHNAVGVGDAENDHALLKFCECGVAVADTIRHASAGDTKCPCAGHPSGGSSADGAGAERFRA